MKPTTKSAILGAVLSTAVILIMSQFASTPAEAQVKIQPEQYKLMHISPDQPLQEQEEAINRLAAEGWKVRSGAAQRLIFVK